MSESERYLDALRKALPRRRRSRVVAELRDHLVEGTAAEMARGLDREAAEQTILARLGPPEVLAAQFSDDARRLKVRAVGALAAGALVILAASLALARSRPAAGSTLGDAAAKAALSQVGAPYYWSGASPKPGFDSSGIVIWAYAKAGDRGLPHDSFALWALGHRVRRAQLQPGDLVFFDDRAHVGIYLGGGRFVHAPHTGASVSVSNLSGRMSRSYVGAVRLGA